MDGFWALGPLLIPIVAIAGWIVAVVMRGRVRELEIRERIAMIERGMLPPPEQDPGEFDRRMHSIHQFQRRSVAPRHRSAGVILMAVGVGMYVLIAYAGGVPQQALGVGGFIAILGLGFFVNSLFPAASVPPPTPPAPPGPQGPSTPPSSGS